MPAMDSRDFTNYLPACCLDQCLMLKYGTLNPNQYRAFIQNHGSEVMADVRNNIVCTSRL